MNLDRECVILTHFSIHIAPKKELFLESALNDLLYLSFLLVFAIRMNK